MRRVVAVLNLVALLASSSLRAQEGPFTLPHSTMAAGERGIISYCYDPDCVGCRTFLTQYGEGSGSGCSCQNGGAGDGKGEYAADAPYDPGFDAGEDLLAEDVGAGFGYETVAPNMIGDSLIGGGMMTHMGPGPSQSSAASLFSFHTFKISEDESPWPKNRAYFDVNSYLNVPGTDEITRYMVGFERTFWYDNASFGVRMPFWSVDVEDLPSSFPAAVPFGEPGSHSAFGDLTLTLKAKLLERAQGILMSGVSFTLPTGPDTLGDVEPYYTMDDVSHLGAVQPSLGFFRSANTYGLFTQGFIAFDVPFDNDDAKYLYLDLGTGYRIPRNGLVTAITPMFEAHWSAPVSNLEQTFTLTPLGTARLAPGFAQGSLTSGVLGYRHQVNLTAALNFEIANSRTLVLGVVAPTVGPQVMDLELIAQMNWMQW